MHLDALYNIASAFIAPHGVCDHCGLVPKNSGPTVLATLWQHFLANVCRSDPINQPQCMPAASICTHRTLNYPLMPFATHQTVFDSMQMQPMGTGCWRADKGFGNTWQTCADPANCLQCMPAASIRMHRTQNYPLFSNAFSSILWQVRRQVTYPCTWPSEEGQGGLAKASLEGRRKK